MKFLMGDTDECLREFLRAETLASSTPTGETVSPRGVVWAKSLNVVEDAKTRKAWTSSVLAHNRSIGEMLRTVCVQERSYLRSCTSCT